MLEEEGEKTAEEEGRMVEEMEDEEMLEMGEFLDMDGKMCLDCAMTPCICILTYLELKVISRGKKCVDTDRKRKRSNSSTAEEDGAGHQHHNLGVEAEAQHQMGGQPHHHHLLGDEVAFLEEGEKEPQRPAKTMRNDKMGGQLPHRGESGEAAHLKTRRKILPDDEEKEDLDLDPGQMLLPPTETGPRREDPSARRPPHSCSPSQSSPQPPSTPLRSPTPPSTLSRTKCVANRLPQDKIPHNLPPPMSPPYHEGRTICVAKRLPLTANPHNLSPPRSPPSPHPSPSLSSGPSGPPPPLSSWTGKEGPWIQVKTRVNESEKHEKISNGTEKTVMTSASQPAPVPSAQPDQEHPERTKALDNSGKYATADKLFGKTGMRSPSD